MPFALTTIGALLIVVGFQDTYKQFFTQLQSDFSGSDSFIYWLLAFGIVGSLGYIKELQTLSRSMMALILLVMFLANKGGVFTQFTQEVNSGDTAPVDSPGAAVQGSPSSGGSTSDGSSDSILGISDSTIASAGAAAFGL